MPSASVPYLPGCDSGAGVVDGRFELGLPGLPVLVSSGAPVPGGAFTVWVTVDTTVLTGGGDRGVEVAEVPVVSSAPVVSSDRDAVRWVSPIPAPTRATTA